MRLLSAAIVALLLTGAVAAFAALPQTINYQGYLKNADGTPTGGNKSMVFSLYSSNPARSNPVWRETQPAVAVTNGIFSARLGSVTPVSASFNVPYWLGVNVAGSGELQLQPLASTGYAFRAGVADSVTPGGSVPGVATWNTTAASSITAAANSGYVLTGATPATVTLPTNAQIGDVVRFSNQGAGGYSFNLDYTQSINGTGIYRIYGSWVARGEIRNWQSIISSADGIKLAAVVYGGQIYTSTDSGAIWLPRENNRNWQSITSSADGIKLAAAVNGGQIYTSTDNGATWVPRESNRNWQSITSSADGIKLAAVVNGGQIYTSTDSGATWVPQESNKGWKSITSSADGVKLAAVVLDGSIFTSDDSGVTWVDRNIFKAWYSIASSADGTTLATVGLGSQIYISNNSGETWRTYESAAGWNSVTTSADGTKLAAIASNRNIYTCSALPIGTTQKFSTTELVYTGNGQWIATQPEALASQGASLSAGNSHIIRALGGVGINHESPGETLAIGKKDGYSAIELGAGSTKEMNAGKIGYQRFSDALDIIGAGTTGSNRKIMFWNEGGATFTGNVGIGKGPTVPLDVLGNANVSGTLSATSASFSALSATSTSLGSVGIGKTATVPLDVAGNANVSGTLSAASASIANSMSVGSDATVSGNLSMGSATRQMLNLYGTLYAMGVQNYTLYSRSDSGFAWYRGGAHSTTQNDPGTGGTGLMTLDASGNLNASGQVRGNSLNWIAVYGVNSSTDAPSVEGWNQGTGDIFRGWSGANGAQQLKFRVLNNGGIIANSVNYPSDIRLKTDIKPLDNTLDKVMKLRGVSYVMKADEEKERKIGVIAQELEQEFPELVNIDEKGMKSVAYANLTAVLIEALKAAKTEKDAEITRLQLENTALQKRLEKIEQLLNSK